MHPTSISIITVTYNAANLLEKTLKSVAEQSHNAIEYIVVDGASKDDTLQVIKRNEHKVDKWISEPDRGIYDAMNKGLKMASGDFVMFLNAGDFFYQKDTLVRVMAQVTELTDILYGETMLVNENYEAIGTRSNKTTRKLPKKLDWTSFQEGMTVCHQSFIARRTVAPPYILNNLAADIDWCIHCLKNSRTILNANQIIAAYLVGGTSQKQKFPSLIDRFKVMNKHYGFFKTIGLHLKFVFRAVK